MSTRARGEHAGPRATTWRPLRPPISQPEPTAPPSDSRACPAPGDDVDVDQRPRPARSRRSWLAVAILAVAAIATAASSPSRPRQAATQGGPTTPRAWFDAYMAAAVDDPARVCHVLFAPELAGSYRHSAAGSCQRYFAEVQDSAVQIERIAQTNDTAVIELRQRRAPRYRWNAVLARRAGDWRAVALVGGR